jgi:hypothetical protein
LNWWKISTGSTGSSTRRSIRRLSRKRVFICWPLLALLNAQHLEEDLTRVLKSPRAVQATLAIIETFTKIRELSRTIKTLSEVKDEGKQKDLMQKSGEIISEILEDDLFVTDTETSIEINFAVLKFKHLIKRKNK